MHSGIRLAVVSTRALLATPLVSQTSIARSRCAAPITVSSFHSLAHLGSSLRTATATSLTSRVVSSGVPMSSSFADKAKVLDTYAKSSAADSSSSSSSSATHHVSGHPHHSPFTARLLSRPTPENSM